MEVPHLYMIHLWRNERNNKIHGVKNTDDFRNNTMGSKKEAELFLQNGNDTEVMQTKV